MKQIGKRAYNPEERLVLAKVLNESLKAGNTGFEI